MSDRKPPQHTIEVVIGYFPGGEPRRAMYSHRSDHWLMQDPAGQFVEFWTEPLAGSDEEIQREVRRAAQMIVSYEGATTARPPRQPLPADD